jgi:hypothetical protein
MSWSAILGIPDDASVKYTPEEIKIFTATARIGWTIAACGLLGIVVIAAWAIGLACRTGPEPGPGFLAFFGADMLVAAAAAAAGALFGFIFGLPRTPGPADRVAIATSARQGGPTAASHADMSANTNLDRVSDWLTTLLIGATLVQIKDIVQWVGSLGKNLVATGPAANDAIVPIIVILYFALSFLGVYLITRLYLTFALLQISSALGGGSVSASDLGNLKKKLAAAVESGTAADFSAAMESYDHWSFSGTEREDPEVNADVARILAKQIASGTPTGRGDAAADLKNAVTKASADENIKAQLKSELASGSLKTGNVAVDAEIGALLD